MASRAKSPNYSAVTRGARRLRTLSARTGGEPSGRLLIPGTNRLRSIRTLIKRDESKGITMPESRNALLTAGNLKVDGNGPSRPRTLSKARTAPSNANKTVVSPPRKGPLKRRISGT